MVDNNMNSYYLINRNQIAEQAKKALVQCQDFSEKMANALEENIKLYEKLPEQISHICKYWKDTTENLLTEIEKLLYEISHKKGRNTFLVISFLESNPKFLNPFISEGVCPPIFYILKGMKVNDAINYDNKYRDTIDIDNLLNDSNLKNYYVESMNEWVDDETELHIKEFIKEIQINFENECLYATTLNLFTLIEYKIRKSAEATGNSIGDNEITRKIIETLKNNCFNKGKDSQFDRLFVTFFNNKSDYYIYKSTLKDPTFITRHILHGERLDLINKKSMMSLVFLTDCLYKMLIDYQI